MLLALPLIGCDAGQFFPCGAARPPVRAVAADGGGVVVGALVGARVGTGVGGSGTVGEGALVAVAGAGEGLGAVVAVGGTVAVAAGVGVVAEWGSGVIVGVTSSNAETVAVARGAAVGVRVATAGGPAQATKSTMSGRNGTARRITQLYIGGELLNTKSSR